MTMQHVSLLFLLLFVPGELEMNYLNLTVYAGDSILLPSGANRWWNITFIEWHIYENNTWIATHRRGLTIVDRVYLYVGRLILDIATGDLLLLNVVPSDAIYYIVTVANTTRGRFHRTYINLEVKERLHPPNITKVSLSMVNDVCVMVFECSSVDSGVHFIWSDNRTDRGFEESRLPDMSLMFLRLPNAIGKYLAVTCTTSARTEFASSTVVVKCEEPPPVPPCTWLEHFMFASGGVLVGVAIPLLVYCLKVWLQHYKMKSNRISLWTTTTDNRARSDTSEKSK